MIRTVAFAAALTLLSAGGALAQDSEPTDKTEAFLAGLSSPLNRILASA